MLPADPKTLVPVEAWGEEEGWMDRGRVEDKESKVVPGRVGDPTMFFFGHVGANETCWVGLAKGPHSSNVLECGVIDGEGNQTVSERNGETFRIGKLHAVRDGEADGRGGRLWRNAGSCDDVTGADGSDHLKVEFDRAFDMGGLKPLER